jgi:hypothetical protein
MFYWAEYVITHDTWICTFRLHVALNVLLRTSQQYGHSPVCTHWCIFRCPTSLNVFTKSQGYVFQDLCKQYEHADIPLGYLCHWMFYCILEWYGCPPACTNWCTCRCSSFLNLILNTSQRCWRYRLCTPWCNFRLLVALNVLLHTSQRYGRSPVCIRWCTFRLLESLNVLLHTSQQ